MLIRPFLALSLIACLSTGQAMAADYPKTDLIGNAYPKECRTDLSTIPARLNFVSEAALIHLSARFGNIVLRDNDIIRGLVLFTLPKPTIFILRGLTKAQMADTIHHERCHILYMTKKGQPHWHKGY